MKKGIRLESAIIIFIIILMHVLPTISLAIDDAKESYMENVEMPYDISVLKDAFNDVHTRVLVDNKKFESIKKLMDDEKNNNYKNEYNDYITRGYEKAKKEADDIVNNKLVSEYDENGLLNVSREVKKRMEYLTFMYKMSKANGDNEGAKNYADRAWSELEAVCKFKDWNPKHFLDTAEMAYAVALGYDWLYDYLSEEQKGIIEDALIKKALIPASKKEYSINFSDNSNNWNLVCHGGIGVAAISIMGEESKIKIPVKDTETTDTETTDTEITDKDIINEIKVNGITPQEITSQDLCAAIISRSIKKMPQALNKMTEAYEEGTGYYIYAMDYATYFLSSLDLTFGTEYGLTKITGLKENLLYSVYITGKSSSEKRNLCKTFNYADSDGSVPVISGLFWLASKYASEDPEFYKVAKIISWYKLSHKWEWTVNDIIWYDKNYDIRYKEGEINTISSITEEELKALGLTKDKKFEGSENIATFRSSYTDKTGVYAAIKGGNNQSSHGDLDIGTFVLDALGTRWVADAGSCSYSFPGYLYTQTNRWNYYKKRAEGHSTLVINPDTDQDLIVKPDGGKYAEADQYIFAQANIENFQSGKNEAFAIVDMTNAYNANDNNTNYENKKDNKNNNIVKRGIKIFDNRRRVMVQDEITFDENTTNNDVYWFMNLDNTNLKSITVSEDQRSAKIVKTENGVDKTLQVNLASTGGKFETMEEPITEKTTIIKALKNIEVENVKVNMNKNEKKLVIHFDKEKNNKITINVVFTPEYDDVNLEEISIPEVKELSEWDIIKAPQILANTETDEVVHQELINKDVTVTITSDNDMEYSYKYSLDDGETWIDYNKETKLKFTEEGRTRIIAKAIYSKGEEVKEGEVSDEFYFTIDKTPPTGIVKYSTKEPTTESVTATITFDEDNVTILNNGGSDTYTFTENGEFEFEYMDIIGNIGKIKVAVDWIEIALNSTKYEIQNPYIIGIEEGTSVETLLNNLETNRTIEIYNQNNKKIEGQAKIGTGMKLRLSEGKEYKLVVTGDLNGDGKVSITDLSKMKLHLIGNQLLQNEYEKAGDLNKDGKFSITDLSKLKTYIINI